MKHAALIMAHKNKKQLIRLIRAVSSDEIDIFVHLDRKWKLSREELAEIECSAPRVLLLKKRIHGVLDHFSLPQIEWNMIRAAVAHEKKTGIRYGYFVLLSGQDYPIKSQRYIQNFLDAQYPKPLIDYDPAVVGNWVWGKYQLTRWNNRIDEIRKNRKKGLLRSFLVALCLVAYRIEKFFCGVPWEKLQKSNFKIYGGSQWWILPHEVIDFVQLQFRKNKKVIRQLKRSWTPDETFFQTLAMNSEQAKLMMENDSIFDANSQKSMTYCNFITPTKGFRGHPHIITMEDYDRIMAKKALFARKFDQSKDREVLDKIDQKRNAL